MGLIKEFSEWIQRFLEILVQTQPLTFFAVLFTDWSSSLCNLVTQYHAPPPITKLSAQTAPKHIANFLPSVIMNSVPSSGEGAIRRPTQEIG